MKPILFFLFLLFSQKAFSQSELHLSYEDTAQMYAVDDHVMDKDGNAYLLTNIFG